ncbi:hypothetical protein RSAG8_08531, partial [Rhizoctonia solani AG-8 WAC10335]
MYARALSSLSKSLTPPLALVEIPRCQGRAIKSFNTTDVT